MKSDQIESLARRVLKFALLRHVYGGHPDPYVQGMTRVASGGYSDVFEEWRKAVAEEGVLTDPTYRDRVLAALRAGLLEARLAIEEMLANVRIDDGGAVASFVEGFQPETYLP